MSGRTSFGYIMLLIVQCSSEDIERPLVISNVGKIRGVKATDGNYFMYLGIPYATVDAVNPFASAVPSSPFKNIFEANDDLHICPHTYQNNNNNIKGTLDCLRLNIYVPETNTLQLTLPVMVWIHSGSFEYGHDEKKTFGPSYLVQHEVIVVTFDYRTGPYGFMCLDIPEVPGNQGLKDQYLAFQWVKNNIEAFGGDSNQITLFGEGAAAHLIHLHLMSTKEVLYNKIILQSGSAQSSAVLHEPDKLAPLTMASYLGLTTSGIKDALYQLSHIDVHLVMLAANSLKIEFGPCAERLFDNVQTFLADSWLESKVPKIENMPVLIGFNKHELTKTLFTKNVSILNNSKTVYDNLRQSFYLPEKIIIELTDLITRFYFSDDDKPETVTWKLIRFISDYTYIHPIHRTLQKYLESGASNIYFYMLSYVGKMDGEIAPPYDEDESNNYLCCAKQADDLAYLFNQQDLRTLNRAEEIFMLRMITMWTNFAKYSDPTPVETYLIPVKWKSVKPNKLYYLNIGTNLTLGLNPLHARMAFWDLFYRQHKIYQHGYEDESKSMF